MCRRPSPSDDRRPPLKQNSDNYYFPDGRRRNMPEPASIRSLITPQDQTLRTVFNAQRSYFIDIYQREYKWTEENVRMLLNDIEVRFSLHKRTKTQAKEIQ